MRLLHTESLLFEEFYDTQVPKYAILSHRWGDNEVTLQDFRKGRRQDTQGYAKIKHFCILASNRGFEWVWIDTCCIDKKSSAELSEAINSMYRWYRGAAECYAYLSDVEWKPEDVEASKNSFKQSLWFTRGWTLQELLAPSGVIFLDRNWVYFGTKESLSKEISAATGIKHEHLSEWHGVCIATKMSWVSKRVTSRLEDLAYCMLGLFDVNMSLLYGEGNKAFIRLQLEIIRKSDDESIFAWITSSQTMHGMLAPGPSCFAQSGDIMIHPNLAKKRFPYVMTNQGLEFQAPYQSIVQPEGEYYSLTDKTLSIALNCWRLGQKGWWRLGPKERPLSVTITLQKLGSSKTSSWQRIECDRLRLSGSVEKSVGDSLGGLTVSDGRVKLTALIYIPQPGL